MFDYARIAATVTRLIEQFGAPAILKRTVNPEYNAASSEVEASEQSFTGRAARVEYELREIDGEHIRFGDARFFMSVVTETGAAMPEPKTGERIQFDGAWWGVVRCNPIKPATVAVAYDVQARK